MSDQTRDTVPDKIKIQDSLYNLGLTIQYIADMYNTNFGTMRRRLLAFGTVMRPRSHRRSGVSEGADQRRALVTVLKSGRSVHICERCGGSKKRTGRTRLDIHHKDRNRKNSADDNLEVLCAVCHLDEHLNDY